eukprot:14330024-Alexandrium_andersonii.AAC.1
MACNQRYGMQLTRQMVRASHRKACRAQQNGTSIMQRRCDIAIATFEVRACNCLPLQQASVLVNVPRK